MVLVKWADAHCGPGGWQVLEDYKDDEEAIVTTVGYLVPEGQPGSKPGHVTLWQTITDDEGIHPFHIPSEMVRSVTILQPLSVAVHSQSAPQGSAL